MSSQVNLLVKRPHICPFDVVSCLDFLGLVFSFCSHESSPRRRPASHPRPARTASRRVQKACRALPPSSTSESTSFCVNWPIPTCTTFLPGCRFGSNCGTATTSIFGWSLRRLPALLSVTPRWTPPSPPIRSLLSGSAVHATQRHPGHSGACPETQAVKQRALTGTQSATFT